MPRKSGYKKSGGKMKAKGGKMGYGGKMKKAKRGGKKK